MALLLAFASTTFAQGYIEGTVYEEAENGERGPESAGELGLFLHGVSFPPYRMDGRIPRLIPAFLFGLKSL